MRKRIESSELEIFALEMAQTARHVIALNCPLLNNILTFQSVKVTREIEACGQRKIGIATVEVVFKFGTVVVTNICHIEYDGEYQPRNVLVQCNDEGWDVILRKTDNKLHALMSGPSGSISLQTTVNS